MVKYNISDSNEIIHKNVFGGKSYWLSWLINNGYKVPPCFFVSVNEDLKIDNFIEILKTDEKFKTLINNYKISDNLFDIAIRSSALNEDSPEKSYAGYFKSFVETTSYEQLFDNIGNVIKSIRDYDNNEKQRIGVVIQKKINAKFSGVVFSSNPITASKYELLISAVEGMGESLVSGKVAGEDILVNFIQNKPELPEYKTKIDKKHLIELCKIVKEIETTLNYPVDIEWCIDSTNNELYILQCRAITTIFPKQTGIIPINLNNENLIPNQVKQNDKVKIRLIAQRNNIDISNAYLVVNNNSSIIDELALSKIHPENRCKGYSVVLIFPKTISGNIIRHFADNEANKQKSAFRTCQRYDVRSYLDYDSLIQIIKTIQSKCCEASWLCVSIIQEIFEPIYTGIIKKIEDGFLIEIAYGHFVPKGVVPTSQYILNNESKLIYKNEVLQTYSYKILNGKVSKEIINNIISIDENTLVSIQKKLMPILISGNQAVEFGLIENECNKFLSPYLIDLVDDNNIKDLNSKLISEGVISTGVRSGKIKIIDKKTLDHNSLEIHFHNQLEKENSINENIIFIAETPDIALLEILKHYNDEKIGFIFKEGSALSHFSIVLREKKIPAIVLDQKIDFFEDETVRIDAISENIKGIERITFGKGCITSYINPDLDGISSSISYSFYKTLKGKNFIPVYFGDLDNETIFTLNYFNVEFPKKLNSVNDFDSIIIVDTHNTAQLSKNILLDNVVEILDHHTDGNPTSFPNAIIQNEEIGSVCTIICERFKAEKLFIPENIAGLLSFGIISNTLNFTAPSTTQRDKDAYEWLKIFICISDDLISKLFESRSSIDNYESTQIIKNNLKEFHWGNKKVGISQIEIININKLVSRADFIDSLLQIKKNLNLDYLIFSGVDIVAHKTILVVPDKETLSIINEGMGYNFNTFKIEVDKIILRKTDLIPKLKRYFKGF